MYSHFLEIFIDCDHLHVEILIILIHYIIFKTIVLMSDIVKLSIEIFSQIAFLSRSSAVCWSAVRSLLHPILCEEW